MSAEAAAQLESAQEVIKAGNDMRDRVDQLLACFPSWGIGNLTQLRR